MTTRYLSLRRLFYGVVLLSCLLANAPRIEASCNQIPGVTNAFRGAHGTINRPFAGPAELVDLRLSSTCDAAASFDDPRGLAISVIFTPPEGPRHVVVMAPSCDAIANDLAACGAQTNVESVKCLPAGLVQLLDAQRLRFPFPNTDTLFDAPDDQRTFSGPATIAVTPIGVPLPCDLASTPCTQHPETLACLDALYAVDGTCGTAPDPLFPHFTALPLPNDYSALCSDPLPPCTGRAPELRFTIDSDGNVLLPMDWSGILLVNQALPVARLLRGSSAIPAFPDGAAPIRIPGLEFLESFSPEGSTLPPIFEPQHDPSATNEVTLFGSADATYTVLRIVRRSPRRTACAGGTNDGRPCGAAADCPGGACGVAACAGGTNAGQSCHADSDCPGSECGPSLFDFRSRLAGGVGPVLIPRFGAGVCEDSGMPCATDASCGSARCVGYRIAAKDPVPLDGLIESPDLFVTVVPEAIEGRDLNGDGDATDEVLLLANRRTGARQPIGVAPAAGRAATRVHDEPFSSPAVAVEDDVVAFLEGEPLQGNIDVNGDGDVFDTPLRIFRSTDSGAEDLLPAPPVMADAAPVLNGASVVVSDGLVFVRVAEMSAARRTVVRASVAADGGDSNGASGRPSLSKDARQVAFESTATNLTASPLALSPYQGAGRGEVGPLDPTSLTPRANVSQESHLTSYVVDLHGGGAHALRLESPLLPPDAASIQPWLSGDGRYVAVAARDTGGISQIFVYDRDDDGNGVFDEPGGTATVLMSQRTSLPPQPSMRDSLFPFITSGGRFVAFDTHYQYGLTPQTPGVNGVLGVVAVDRDRAGTGVFDDWERDDDHDGISDGVSLSLLTSTVSNLGAGAPSTLQRPAVSEDGTVATYATFDRNLANGAVTPDYNDFCLNLADSTPSCVDVLVRGGHVVGHNRLASYSTVGEQANNHSLSAMISGTGRSVVYTSAATNLVPGDTNGAFDVFAHDIQFDDGVARGTTTRVSVASDGTQANGPSFDRILGISDDGRYVAFASSASNLVRGDTNNLCDNDLDGRAEENCSDIFIHDRTTGFTERASIAATGAEANGASHHASLSGDGRTVAFESTASNLVPEGNNDRCDSNGDGAACSNVFVSGPDRADPAADFNGDGDANDTLLEVFDTRQPERGLAVIAPARQVAIVGDRAAFLSPEAESETDLNGDGDTKDTVIELYTGRNGRVINLQRAARALAMSEHWLAALVSEADEEQDLNGDGERGALVVLVAPSDGTGPWTNLGISANRIDAASDTVAFTTLEPRGREDEYGNGINDLVLKLYDASTATLIDTDQAVEEFVLGPDLVAFRTSEAVQGQDLNGDGDTDDFILQVYDVRTRRLINTGQTAIPCRFEACDPRVPYRVSRDSVKFLTLESEQGQDLNGDGDMDDLVLQTFNVPKALAAMEAAPMASRRFQRSERRRADGSVSAGVLTTLGALSVGICSDTGNACAGAADCGVGAHCFLPPGGCVTNLHTSCDTTLASNPCGEHQYCVPTKILGRGECYQAEGSCRSDADCTAPGHCRDAGQSVQRLISPLLAPDRGGIVFTAAGTGGQLVVAGAGDADGDGIADPFDNCPYVANPDQVDANGNRVGDACEAGGATPSPTAVATNTPAAAHRDEGCAVGPRANGSVAYVVSLGACVLWALRRRKKASHSATPVRMTLSAAADPANGFAATAAPGRPELRVPGGAALFVALLLATATVPAAPASAVDATPACAGDCDGSGSVTIDELITLVNIALGAAPVTACTAGDLDAGGSVTIEEILAAVGHAMDACPLPTEQLAGSVAVLAHGLSYLPFFEPILSAYFSAAGGSGDCPSGGSLTSSCDESESDMIRISIVAGQCAIPTIEGTATVDGTAPLIGTGLCPSVLVPGGWQMTLQSTVLLETPTQAALFDAQFDLAATIQSLAFGGGPCRLRGGAAVLDGSATYAPPDGGQVTLSMDALRSGFQLSDFSLVDFCQPATIAFTLDGDLHVTDAHAEPAASIDVALRGLTVTIHRASGRVEINGGITAPWAGGSVTLATAASLLRPLEQPCFTGGALNLDASGTRTQVVFSSGGGVAVDRGADGSIEATFGSCLDAGLRPSGVPHP